MADVLIRDVDPLVVERLKRKAAERRVSLSAVAREALSSYSEPDRARLMEEVRAIRSRTGRVTGDSTDLIREDRDNNDAHR